jgi:hypothetical protein
MSNVKIRRGGGSDGIQGVIPHWKPIAKGGGREESIPKHPLPPEMDKMCYIMIQKATFMYMHGFMYIS